MPPYFLTEDDGFCHDRNSLYLSIGAPSGARDDATLVVSQPLPRHSRQATLPRMHQIVKPGRSFQSSMSLRNQTVFTRLGHAHPRLEISK
jgi:hypothetical protein